MIHKHIRIRVFTYKFKVTRYHAIYNGYNMSIRSTNGYFSFYVFVKS